MGIVLGIPFLGTTEDRLRLTNNNEYRLSGLRSLATKILTEYLQLPVRTGIFLTLPEGLEVVGLVLEVRVLQDEVLATISIGCHVNESIVVEKRDFADTLPDLAIDNQLEFYVVGIIRSVQRIVINVRLLRSCRIQHKVNAVFPFSISSTTNLYLRNK